MEKRLRDEFGLYIKNNYDMNNSNIIRKYYHSYRVMDLCRLISKSEGMNENDIEISSYMGLLHDIGRFEQWKVYNTYDDLKSIDHAEMGIKMLFDYQIIKKFYLLKNNYDEIYDAIKYHNKLNLPTHLSEHNKIMCKVLRDADKLDILYLISIKAIPLIESNDKISSKVEIAFINKKSIDKKDIKNSNDSIILRFAFVFDLNYKYSFEYLKRYRLIDKIYNNLNNKEMFKPYVEIVNNYIDNYK